MHRFIYLHPEVNDQKGIKVRILNSPAAVCFIKRISEIPMTTGR